MKIKLKNKKELAELLYFFNSLANVDDIEQPKHPKFFLNPKVFRENFGLEFLVNTNKTEALLFVMRQNPKKLKKFEFEIEKEQTK